MTVAEDLSALDGRIDTLMRRIDTLTDRMSGQQGAQCSAERPHPGRLVYLRSSNDYSCDCGMVYEKNAQGGLKVK